MLVPLFLGLVQRWLPLLAEVTSLINNWRVLIAGAVLVCGLIVVHIWLPAGKRRLVDVMPGIALTVLCWLAGASVFAAYLEGFASYVSTYAGLASIMIALVFLYMISAIFIFGRRAQRLYSCAQAISAARVTPALNMSRHSWGERRLSLLI